MKKANYYILTGILVFVLGFYVLKPLSGKINGSYRTEKDGQVTLLPKDHLSDFMLLFSKKQTAKPIPLDNIDHIVLNGIVEKSNWLYNPIAGNLEIHTDGVNKIQFNNRPYLVEVDHEVKNRTLYIQLNTDAIFGMELHLGKTPLQSLTINGQDLDIFYQDIDTISPALQSFIINKKSNVSFGSGNIRGGSKSENSLNIQVNDESTVNLKNSRINRLNVKLNNSLLVLGDIMRLDTLHADLNGLSHIRGARKLDYDGKTSIKLTGNLDYYNAH
ncbi:hypothetical protein GCM10022216_04480 [Sphingobacterium kyonggiense]|uniref:Auto-transporter adhesin head GIN domain-containing protein n=1 Tax=Sphingobacterium kyonggiense TaxID=714075 RepID=A0ABP7Y9Q8_9SPHI